MSDSELFLSAAALFMFVLISNRLKSRGVTIAMAFTAYGILLGPLVLGFIHVDLSDRVIKAMASITLVLTLFTDAMRVDVDKLKFDYRMPVRMLGIGLPLTILLGVGVAVYLFPDLTLSEAALLAVILAPTDAALGQPVLNEQSVPPRVRRSLNVESGLNDGLGLPALVLIASFATVEGTGAHGEGNWASYIALQLLLGPLTGAVIGWVGSESVEFARKREWLNDDHMRLTVLGLALLAYSAAEMDGGNGFMAAFFCGLLVATRSDRMQQAAHAFETSAGQLFSLAIFLIFGAALLPQFMHHITWHHALFAVLALTVLRMGPVALSLLGLELAPATLAFVGWFGPRGMASIIYLLILVTEYQIPAIADIGATVVLTILISILIHGVSASPLARRYGRSMERRAEKASGSCAEYDPGQSGSRPAP